MSNIVNGVKIMENFEAKYLRRKANQFNKSCILFRSISQTHSEQSYQRTLRLMLLSPFLEKEETQFLAYDQD